MTESRKVQLESGVDATGARQGFAEIAQAGQDMARKVAQSGKEAAAGVDGIGGGAEKATQKITAAERSIIASIQRTTAAMQAGERGTASYFERLGQQRGASPEALRPYLDQLRATEAASKAAAAGVDQIGLSAKQTAAALRGVPAQFTDIVTSIASGQQPLTVLLQQGGQLKDMFGGAGAAARALGGYIVGLINPFTLAAGAAAVLTAAYKAGSDEATAYARAIILSGNAAGVTAGQLQEMARGVAAMGAGTQGRAAEVLTQIASAAGVGAGNMQRFTAAAIAFERAGGPAAEETAKAFANLAKEPLAASLKLNEATNYLTASTIQQIKALEDAGRSTDAARLAQEAYASAIETRTPQLVNALGSMERGWLAVKDAVAGAWDAVKAIGREDVQQQLAAVRAAMERVRAAPAGERFRGADGREVAGRSAALESLRQEEAFLQERLRMDQRGAEAAGQRAAAGKAAAEWDKESEKYIGNQVKLRREIAQIEQAGLAAGKSRAEIEALIARAREKYTEKTREIKLPTFKAEEDGARAYMRALDGIAKVAADASASADGLTKTQAKLLEIQSDPAWQSYSRQQREQIITAAASAQAEEDRAAAVKRAADEAKRAQTAWDDWIRSAERGADAIERQVQQSEIEAEARGMVVEGYRSLAQAIQEVEIRRLREAQAIELSYGNDIAAAAIEREIKAREKLIGLIGEKEAREANDKAAKDAARDWDRATQQIEQSLTDAIMAGGKSGADYIKDLFRTLVLRPIVSAIVNPVAGALMGAAGFSGAAQAAGAAGGLGNVGSALGLAGALGSFSGYAATGLMSTLTGTGLGTTLGAAGSLVSGGSVAGGLGLGLGAVAPYLAAAAVVASLLKDKSAKLGYGATSIGADGTLTDAQRLFGFGRGTEVGRQDQLQTFAETVGAAIVSQAELFGGSAAGLQVQAATDIDRKGKASGTIQVLVNGSRAGGVQTGGTNPLAAAATKLGSADEVSRWFSENSSAAVIAGLQASDLPQRFKDYFSGISAYALSQAEADELLSTASAVQQVGKAFAGLGPSFDQLAEISVAAVETIFAAAGGAEQFQASAQSYYAAYYTEAERAARTTDQITQALAELGVALPANRKAFRDLVDAQDLTTEGGRKTYAALLSLAGAFAEITPALDDMTASLQQAGSAVQDEIERLRGQSSTGKESQAALLARFGINTAQARAGDADALAALPAISQALEEAAKASASSALDIARMRAWLAGSLSDTLGTVPGFAAGGFHRGGLRLVGETGPEIEATGPARIYSSTETARLLDSGRQRTDELLAQAVDLLERVQEAAAATAMHSHSTAKQLRRAMPDGDALAVRTATD